MKKWIRAFGRLIAHGIMALVGLRDFIDAVCCGTVHTYRLWERVQVMETEISLISLSAAILMKSVITVPMSLVIVRLEILAELADVQRISGRRSTRSVPA